MIRHFLNPPNWFTSASIFCSVFAVATVASAETLTPQILARACVVVIFGTVFDLLDGRVARMTKRATDFGVQLDSLADLISFGLAPAILVYLWALKQLGLFGIIVAFWYVLCTAFRLARFNVGTRDSSWAFKGHSQGLTSTMAGFCLVSLVWASIELPVHPWLIAAVVAGLGLLMVSSIPFRNFRDMRTNPRARTTLALGLAVTLLVAIAVLDVSAFFGAAAAFYVGWGLVDGIVANFAVRRQLKLAEVDVDDDEDDEEDD